MINVKRCTGVIVKLYTCTDCFKAKQGEKNGDTESQEKHESPF